MRASKLGLLILILGFGAALETIWSVRHHLDVGPAGCRVLGGRFYGTSFNFRQELRRGLAAGTRVEVVNAFGAVEATLGEPGQLELALEKVVYVGSRERAHEFAERVELRLEETGDRIRVSTNRDELDTSRVGLETHLRLRLPPGTPLSVFNEHGRVDVSDVAAVEAENSFEPLSVRRIAGDARLKSRHGPVTVEGVQGSLTLNARYGNVTLTSLAGPARLELEHGDVSASRLAGLSLTQRYGELRADDISGELKVDGQHLGVSAHDVGGPVAIETSYRDVSLIGIGGEVSVAAQHGRINVEQARGAVLVRTSYDDVALDGIAGPVDVAIDHGGLRAARLQAGIRARVAGDDVVLEDFRGTVDVEASRADVVLDPRAALTDGVRVTVRNGGIRFAVPPAGGFRLQVAVKRGEIDVRNVPAFTVTESGAGRLSGRAGPGGNLVRLEAEQGDVTLEPRQMTAERMP